MFHSIRACGPRCPERGIPAIVAWAALHRTAAARNTTKELVMSESIVADVKQEIEKLKVQALRIFNAHTGMQVIGLMTRLQHDANRAKDDETMAEVFRDFIKKHGRGIVC